MSANWLKLKQILLICLLLAWSGPALAASLQITVANQDLREHVQEIFLSAQTRLQRLSGADPPLIIIEIPASGQAYNNRLQQLGAPLWAAGITMGHHIILRPPLGQGGSLNFGQVLLHELGHVYLNQALPGAPVPWWLREGLAMLAARQNPDSLSMAGAVLQQKLLPWAQMDADFFPKPQQVELAYAQAFHMSLFLHEHNLLQPLIRGLAQGHDLNRSLHAASGKPLSYWEEQFRQAMGTRFSWLSLLNAGGAWAILGLLAAIILLIGHRNMRVGPKGLSPSRLDASAIRDSTRPLARGARRTASGARRTAKGLNFQVLKLPQFVMAPLCPPGHRGARRTASARRTAKGLNFQVVKLPQFVMAPLCPPGHRGARRTANRGKRSRLAGPLTVKRRPLSPRC